MNVTSVCIVVLVFIGTAYGSTCTDSIYTDFGSNTKYCDNGCCGDVCCLFQLSTRQHGMDFGDDRGYFDTYGPSDISENSAAGLAVGYILLIVGLVIAKIVFWVCVCYCCCRRRDQTVVIMQPAPTSVQVTANNPMHAGYDQGAYAQNPPPYTSPPKQTK